MDESNVQVGLFYIRKADWGQFLEMMEDSTDNFSTWENWKISCDQIKIDLFNQRVDAVEIVVDLDDFENWCHRKALPLNAASRSRYAAEILQRDSS